MSYIRQRILETLSEEKMTQKELSERANVPYISLNRFLSGSRDMIGIETLLKIANGLNMPIDFLISQRNVESSMLLENVVFKINRLAEEERKKFLLSISNILDIVLLENTNGKKKAK